MNINQYLDSTYLKTPSQANISQKETQQKVFELIDEAINNNFKLVMIRPDFVSIAKERISKVNSNVLVGTVIGFHKGTATTENKLEEAQKAIENHADELDFVINYTAFLEGKLTLLKVKFLKERN